MTKAVFNIALLCLVVFGCAPAETPSESAAEETPTADATPASVVGLLNPNFAGEEALAAVLSEDQVSAVIDGRPFLSMADLTAAVGEGLGEAELEAFASAVFVPLNLNTASREEILMVPGIGDRMAHEFEEYRPYTSIEQFRREMGKYVDDDEVARMEQFVFVPVNINTAGDDEILSIPGVGDRMLHEFKEYRPYTNIEQFRREIGKYVDENEVARLERYITM